MMMKKRRDDGEAVGGKREGERYKGNEGKGKGAREGHACKKKERVMM